MRMHYSYRLYYDLKIDYILTANFSSFEGAETFISMISEINLERH